MKEKRMELSERFLKFAIDIISFLQKFEKNYINIEISRQVLRSACSIGANWEESIGGLTVADFTHTANIARKEARETLFWLKVILSTNPKDKPELELLINECNEITSILTSIVKKQQAGKKNISKNISFLLLFVFSSFFPHPSSLIPHPSSLLFAGDWPVFRGNNGRTGFVSEQASPPLTKIWEYQAGADIISSPVVFDNMVYFGSRDKKIYAFNARTAGAPVWQFQTGGWVDATPAVSGNAVYVPSMDGWLYALNRLTGALLWRAKLGASSVSSPLILKDKVFVGTGSPEKKLKIFDASSGQLLSEYKANQPVDSAPSSDGERIYFGANDSRIYALSHETFSLAWSEPYQSMGGCYGMNAVAVSSSVLYALPGCDENKPLALNVSDGTLLNLLSEPFEQSTSWERVGSPVVSGDRVYFSGGASENFLYSINAQPSDGALEYVWSSTPTLGNISGIGVLSSPSMANEIMYIGTVNGSLVAFSSTGASVPLVADVSFSSPVYSSPAISNGMVFVATAGGKIIAYKTERAVSFSSPGKSDIVHDTVTIKGYISNPALSGWTLDYGEGDAPSSWQTVKSSVTSFPVENGTLAEWDTTGLPNGVYTLKLTAQGSGADNTAYLNLRINSVPLAPTGLTAADVPGDSGNRIKLDWTASVSGGITAHKIYRNAGNGYVKITSLGPDATTYIDTTAVTGTTFTYVVRAFDGYLESENSNSASAYSINNTNDNTPPGKITDLTASPGPIGGMVELVWTAPGNDGYLGTASHYLIRYTSISSYDWNNFEGVGLSKITREVEGPAGAREADDIKGLFGGVTYYFAIKTADFVPNISPLSNIATAYAAVDSIAPVPPTGLVVADTPGDEGGSLTLTWNLSADDGANHDDVYGYRIYRRLQNSSYGSPLTQVPKATKSYNDTSASENVRFYYSVAAFDSTNNSVFSNEASGISADNWRFFDASRGCSVRLNDGAMVDVPGNAASQNGKIMISRLDPVTYVALSGIKANTRANPTPVVYEIKFKNPNIKLIKPAVITLPFTDAEVDGMNRENLRIYTLSEGTWLMLNTSKPYPEQNKVVAEATHFSFFRIMEYVPSGSLLSADSVYTYPNPAKGDTLTFKFLVSDKSYVTVDVYNVAGEKVARLEKANCPAGGTSELIWDIRNIASGVYVYRVQAKSSSGEKSVTKKLAIIK